ncbi:MAG: PaaI family thioesterase [Proteobacteria bacterium]|nr:PaaI family thioesterase [Pseudomonadota bacterium]
MPHDKSQVDLQNLQDVAAKADTSPFAQLAGLRITHTEPGRAVAQMTVDQKHVNMYAATHGGALFALADHACSVAGNSLGRQAVMTHTYMTFMKNPRLGQTIIAEARVIHAGKRAGQVEITIRDEDGQTLAVCQAGTAFLE